MAKENESEWDRYIDEEWLGKVNEEILEPEIPITDPHHHLMAWPFHYELAETLADFCGGHKVRTTVHMEAHSHYRTEGPEQLRPVGETEYVVVAAEQAERSPGASEICAGIVGHVDVMRGEEVDEVLQAHIEAALGRFRGIRVNLYWLMHPDRPWTQSPIESLVDHPAVRAALGRLAPHNLSCDLVAFHSNLPDVARTTEAFEDTIFIVNHLGAPITPNANPDHDDMTRSWRRGIDAIASRPNIRLKLGGCTNPILSRSIPPIAALKQCDTAPSSEEIADGYRPYVEYCIDQLGPDRCMFESNFPIDKAFASYATLWNAFKRLAAAYSLDERKALLGGTAAATYGV